MGWIFSLALFVAGLVHNNDQLMFIASGLFAIAGCIGAMVTALKEKK